MADGKWISDLHAQVPVAEAARRVLSVRLGVVQERLLLAVTEADKDPEHVHQLRVGTRRAGAALEIFALCLPDRAQRRARRLLRKLRRAAGAARDWDVFVMHVAGRLRRTRTEHRPGLDFLVGYGVGQRVAAQATLDEVGRELMEDIDDQIAETLHAIRPPDPAHGIGVLGDLARPMLKRLLGELSAAANRNLDEYEHLHQVRILGKQLRYAMEVFVTCFAPAFREKFYPAVVEMQEILGAANDSYVAAGRLETVRTKLTTSRPADWPRYEPGIDGLLRAHRRRLPQQRRAFLAWWQNWQQSGAEAALAGMLRETALVHSAELDAL